MAFYSYIKCDKCGEQEVDSEVFLQYLPTALKSPEKYNTDFWWTWDSKGEYCYDCWSKDA